MKTKLAIQTVAALAAACTALLCVMAQTPNASKSYPPGAYGKVKNAPMFICWREWDGEIRLGGVAKSLSTPCGLGDIGKYFAVEIQGPSGCANQERLLFGAGTTNIVLGTNYVGTIQIGTNFFKASELLKR